MFFFGYNESKNTENLLECKEMFKTYKQSEKNNKHYNNLVKKTFNLKVDFGDCGKRYLGAFDNLNLEHHNKLCNKISETIVQERYEIPHCPEKAEMEYFNDAVTIAYKMIDCQKDSAAENKCSRVLSLGNAIESLKACYNKHVDSEFSKYAFYIAVCCAKKGERNTKELFGGIRYYDECKNEIFRNNNKPLFRSEKIKNLNNDYQLGNFNVRDNLQNNLKAKIIDEKSSDKKKDN